MSECGSWAKISGLDCEIVISEAGKPDFCPRLGVLCAKNRPCGAKTKGPGHVENANRPCGAELFTCFLLTKVWTAGSEPTNIVWKGARRFVPGAWTMSKSCIILYGTEIPTIVWIPKHLKTICQKQFQTCSKHVQNISQQSPTIGKHTSEIIPSTFSKRFQKSLPNNVKILRRFSKYPARGRNIFGGVFLKLWGCFRGDCGISHNHQNSGAKRRGNFWGVFRDFVKFCHF